MCEWGMNYVLVLLNIYHIIDMQTSKQAFDNIFTTVDIVYSFSRVFLSQFSCHHWNKH